VSIFISRAIESRSWEKYEDDFHQYHVRQDYEQRGQNYRARSRPAHTCCASLCPHSLKTRDRANDQSKHGGLKRRWQEIVKIGAVETGIDELV
jgi:hypothetical protein